MKRRTGVTAPALAAVALAAQAATLPAPVRAQDLPVDDPVVRSIVEEGSSRSRLEPLAHALLDSIGPRLSGTAGYDAAVEWLVARYEEWGLPVRADTVGTWTGWEAGPVHVDLLEPRRRSLEAHLLAYSTGTDGPLEAPVILLPEGLTEENAGAWLAGLEGAFVLATPPEPTCRAPGELEANARPETVARIDSLRTAYRVAWARKVAPLGGPWRALRRLGEGRPAGVLSSWWSEGWGATKIHEAFSSDVPHIALSCEDYGLLYRLAERGAPPRIRVDARAERTGEAPHANVIAEIRGTGRPHEYVVLSAHLDSWHAASGATDNGTGTLIMLEAMRLLKAAGVAPSRTILVGHWAGEEQGLIGSRAFVEDHPDVVSGLQAVFNQDNGTWRIERIEGQGLLRAGERLGRWISYLPREIADGITLELPGTQDNTGSDHSSFLCAGAPAFRLQSPYDEYRRYTWHTERDTFDKLVFEDLRQNAILAAVLAWAAAEDPEPTPRDRALLPADPETGEPRAWLECRPARRTPPEG
jgi:carboxypeptidase Q